MVDIKELEKLRPCGRLETFSTARHHLGYYNNVQLTASYISPSPSSRSLEATVYAALRKVIAQHPNLSAITLNEEKSYPDVYFARLPSIDLRTCVEFCERKGLGPIDGETDEELDRLLTDHHNRGFKDDLGTKPFWRLAVLTSLAGTATFTAAWIFHHALADGASAFLFHETFLAALNSLESDLNVNPIVASPKTPLLPSLEELHPMTISWSYFLKAISISLLPSVFNKRPAKLWTGNPIPTTIPSRSNFNFRTFASSTNATKRLALASRKEGVSVTATLQCLVAASIFANLPTNDFDKVNISGPMAMRRFLRNIPEDQMTAAIGSYNFLHQRISPEKSHDQEKPSILQHFSWDEVRAVKSTMQTELAKEGRDNNAALLKYVPNMHEFFTGHLGKPRMPTVELSSIGVYKPKLHAEGAGPWEIGRMTFSQCPSRLASAFGVNIVTGGDGNASVNFCWCDGAVEEEIVGRIIECLKEGIEALVEAYQG